VTEEATPQPRDNARLAGAKLNLGMPWRFAGEAFVWQGATREQAGGL
jgi:hypothetical protein